MAHPAGFRLRPYECPTRDFQDWYTRGMETARLRGVVAGALLATLWLSSACSQEPMRTLGPAVGDEFTLVVLPDTQSHIGDPKKAFRKQLQWIVDHAETHRIAYVLHVGDIVDWNKPYEWRSVRKDFALLDQARLPYALAIGNHDMGKLGSASNRTTLLNKYFELTDLRRRNMAPREVFEPGHLENGYYLFTAGGIDWMILVLEFGPRDAVLAWANELCQRFSDRRIIVLTHAYQNKDGSRQDEGDRFNPRDKGMKKNTDSINDGARMWDQLIRHHANIDLVLSGHVPGVSRARSRGDAGNVVHEIMANYQDMEKETAVGWLRILRVVPRARRIDVFTYGAATEKFWRDDPQQFSVSLDTHE